ncbi:hypothetical protein HDG37_006329 [Paraburkholderia sp. MM5384-R2]|nr:hypothetical protein [Paraburkholderia sp. MM5384-R2]
MPELYEVFNPMPYRGAQDMEVELAIGSGVWGVAGLKGLTPPNSIVTNVLAAMR